ncbi:MULTISPECIES: dienelactone hydrolase family protein [Gammaproteobacteria]|uniref:dienelactone hydrolase family protein n=1 Tax=Gammaproteobacteria TaxID=1236 RepID=UPI000DD08F8B|nr:MULTISPECIES: dienelactone hydrolase family protein [Gammaproteobacteria]RTE87723.1 dienelactone hydrolase family protein [Aliidiomarina sp. B3213]TCZ92495.1 dienelactone hydrolase family protein [Lysobacter sp. N42]
MRSLLLAVIIGTFCVPAFAKIETSYHEYRVGNEVMRGYVAWNSRLERSLGTVLIVHDWDGPNDYEEGRAEQLAALGYTAFAVDVYGKDNQPTSMDENRERATEMYQNRELFRQRLMGAMNEVAHIPGGTENIVAMGYCFGGAAVLEMARAGAGLNGYASFHGGLNLPEGQNYESVDAPVIILHGSADPVSGMSDVAALLDGLEAQSVQHEAHIYGGARHSFTVPWSGDYLLEADRASWAALLNFLDTNL